MRSRIPLATPPLSSSFLSLIHRCSTLKHAQALHARFISLGLARFAYVASRLLALYALHDADYAHRLFQRILHPTIFDWNVVIRAYSASPYPHRAIASYVRMRRRDVAPNVRTFPFAVKSCAALSVLSQLHGQLFRFGFHLDVFVTSSLVSTYSSLGSVDIAAKVFDESPNPNVVSWTSLVSGYSTHGMVDKARSVFDQMPERNAVSWSAMIAGYVHNERHREAIQLFRELKRRAIAELSDALLVSALNACASLGEYEEGRLIHSFIEMNGTKQQYEFGLGTALVDFYSKCGFVDSAREVFDRIPHRDVTAWSAMIMGLALNGDCRSAIAAFSDMISRGVKPNAITFVGVLTACGHGGLIDEGRKLFRDMMAVYGVRPTVAHLGCMVDLLSRAGHTAEAESLVEAVPAEADGAAWGALLSGCLVHGDYERGERAGRRVVELEPKKSGRRVGLANVYASMRRWEGVEQVRREMRARRVTAAIARSSVEVGGFGQRFGAYSLPNIFYQSTDAQDSRSA